MGWINNKGNLPQFEEGGKVEKKKSKLEKRLVTKKQFTDEKGNKKEGIDVDLAGVHAGKRHEKTTAVKKDYITQGNYEVATSEVGGKGGGKRRQYRGVGKSEWEGMSNQLATRNAKMKAIFNPADSLRTTKGEHLKFKTKKQLKKDIKKGKL